MDLYDILPVRDKNTVWLVVQTHRLIPVPVTFPPWGRPFLHYYRNRGIKMKIKLTVFFEDAFWVGVFERTYDGRYEVHKTVFGSEPKDYEIYEFLKERYTSLKFSDPIDSCEHAKKPVNPKRLQRKIHRELQGAGTGTKAQEALKLQYAAVKQERKEKSKELKEQEKQEKFLLRQQKKKEKHKGH